VTGTSRPERPRPTSPSPPGNTRTAFDAIRVKPCPVPPSARHHRLKHDLAWGTHHGRRLEQWQYEVTGGGGVGYLLDHDTRTAWLVYAGTGHPRQPTSEPHAG
jgi:hypothetical protein